jgi:flagellar hook-basal body complex protein FliE
MQPISMETLLARLAAAREALAQGMDGAGAMPPRAATTGRAGAADFGAVLRDSLARVDADQTRATTLAERFQLGDPKATLEETMVAVQKASLSFQQLVQIRNRVVSAYHDIMNMQV